MKTRNVWTLLAINGLVAGSALLAPSLAVAGDAQPAAPKNLLDAWNNSDAPFTFAGITIYGTIDAG